MNVMQSLREGTAELHKHAESRALEQALIGGTLARESYVALLAQRFLVHRVLENAARALAARDPRIAAILDSELFQESNLRADLAFFDTVEAACVPLASTRRLIDAIEAAARENPLSVLGFYYVFEGSKNGARFIARRLRGAYGLEHDGLRYLDPHGDRQRPLWEAFKTRMDAAGFSPAEIASMVETAKLTFQCVADMDDELMAPQMCT